MSSLELSTVDRLEVQSLDRSFNQAAILTAVHHVPVDSVAVLAAGTEVIYTDFDLGVTFCGRIVEVDRSYADGEGVRYRCADAWRTFAKTPAEISDTTRIAASTGTSSLALLTEIMNNFLAAYPACLPGGVDLTGLDDVELPAMDRGGETVDTWINDILGYTDDGVAWIDVNGGSPRLVVRRFQDQAVQPLEIGNFDIKSITPGGNPLLVGAGAGENLNKKYKTVRLEGCGNFTRFYKRLLEPIYVSANELRSQWTLRYNIPEDWATARYINEDGECAEYTEVTISVGWQGSNPANFTIPAPEIQVDEDTGQNYFLLEVHLSGVFFTVPPALPFVAAWWTYTGYTGPMKVEQSSPDSKLDCEGVYVEQHDGYFNYTDLSPLGQSQTLNSEAVALVSRLYNRHSVAPDVAGDVTVHIKGTTPMELGKALDDPAELQGARIRNLTYEFTRRDIRASLSDEPIRDNTRELRQRGKMVREVGNNWFHKEVEETSCFCGGEVVAADENGNVRGPNQPPNQDRFDCVQGHCDKVAGGQYTDPQCKGKCNNGQDAEWKFVPCAGCVPADQWDWGPYATKGACTAANPDPTGGEDCGASSSAGDAPTVPPLSGKNFVCDGCSFDEGTGNTFVGFVKEVSVDPDGNVKQVSCATCEISGGAGFDPCTDTVGGTGQSGFTGQISYVSAVSVGCCSSGDFSAPVSLGYGILSFECGIFLGAFPTF